MLSIAYTGAALTMLEETLSSVSALIMVIADETVRGKRRKDTVLICLSQDDVDEGKIAMNKGGLNTPRLLSNLADWQWPEATVPSRSATWFTYRRQMISNTARGTTCGGRTLLF